MIALLAVLLLVPQDGELDRIVARFQQRREKARSEGEFRRLLADARLELEQFIKENPKHKDLPRAAFQIAETYLAGQDYDRAAERLQAYLRDYPTGSDAPSAHERPSGRSVRSAEATAIRSDKVPIPIHG